MDTENSVNSVLAQQPRHDSPSRSTEHPLLKSDPITNPITSAIARWPAESPLAVLSAGRRDAIRTDSQITTDSTRSASPRWTILASPASVRPIQDPRDLNALLTPRAPATRQAGSLAGPDAPPFRSGRLVMLTYELGHTLEPASGARSAPPPLGFVAECPETFAFDHTTGRWTAPPPADPPPNSRPDPAPIPHYRLGAMASETGADAYRASVRRALGYIRAGDVYQVNLAHRCTAPFEGSSRALAADLFSTATPSHGVYAELQGGSAIVSASPELFLSFDSATRRVRTEPMKGTRPISGDPEELRAAGKDRAELDMITDLMRNDLGRVCDFGSMRVDRARTIEAHGSSVWQATSTVSGTLREGLTPADLVRETFPPGSVTGAPKVRAMQIIRELEPVPRGFYCGALGWLDDSGSMSLNVAIRTATVRSADDGNSTLTYHAGAGIVADSDPDAEWAETLGKAEILSRLAERAPTDQCGT